MVNYVCSICKKEYNHKGDYNRHINRKKKCELLSTTRSKIRKKEVNKPSNCSKTGTGVPKNEQLSCKYCKKMFKKKFNLKRHLKTCKEKEKNDNLKEELFELLLVNQKKQKEQYDKRIEELQKEIVKLSLKTNNSFKEGRLPLILLTNKMI